MVLKQTNDSNGDGGELHLGLESFSSLMMLLKGLESELLKNQNPTHSTFNNDNVSYDPNLLLDGMFENVPTIEEYSPTQPGITHNSSPIGTVDIPKKTRKRRSDAGIKKKRPSDLTLAKEVED